MEACDWDVFISHASEDKDTIVRPLVEALERLGSRVWYDELTLRPGDSLSQSIDSGLAKSRYGVVVLSPSFLTKPWPRRELDGLVTREINDGLVVIPLWHGVTAKAVADFSPPLADKVAIKTDDTDAADVAIKILRVSNPELYMKHGTSQLKGLARGAASRKLQEEIERARAVNRPGFIGGLVS